MSPRKLLVTHHAPDLDAVGAVWLFKTFDTQHYGHAKIAFVNPGDTISDAERKELGFEPEHVVHVDTGLGEFDHHQPDRGQQHISATSLVYDHICEIHPDLVKDTALKYIVDFITGTDHFDEVNWPDASHHRYVLMIHSLIRGHEFTDMHDDDSQMQFGMQCLTNAYAGMKQRVVAEEILASEGEEFETTLGKGLALETSNDDTLKLGQKRGYQLVLRKDPKLGNVRIKLHPDSNYDLKPLADKINSIDTTGTWFYHASGKMLLNGSSKHRSQKATPLTLTEVINLIKEIYA